jgi:transposase
MSRLKNSNSYVIKRLDHLGIVAGVIKDLGIVELINDRLGIYVGENITAGETVAGMIINGLGFSQKPLSLMPQFFESCPLDILFREGVNADDFNRFKLGRVLDRCHGYGTELLFSEISLHVCKQEQVDTRFNSEDTTSFTLDGDYAAQSDDDDTISVRLGHSKAHRPDLKQVMLEMMVSQDGGIPLLAKSLDGNASDNVVFQERSAKLIEEFKQSDMPRYLIADSKLYSEKNAVNLKDLSFITRIPSQLKIVGETIDKALSTPDDWRMLADERFVQTFEIDHYGMTQRWHVLSSSTSRERAEKQVDKRIKKESDTIKKQLFHLQAQQFHNIDDAQEMAQKMAKKWKFHNINNTQVTEHKIYKGKGRPKKDAEPIAIKYKITVTTEKDDANIKHIKDRAGHYIIGGNALALSDQEMITAYKDQHHVESGFRFLKDPLFFTSSLFVKRPERIMGLLMVMLLSLLVYGIAERRLRANLKQYKETLPNQIGEEIEVPTLRWVFQMMHGIHHLRITMANQVEHLLVGITELKQKILRFFGETVEKIYQFNIPIDENTTRSM